MRVHEYLILLSQSLQRTTAVRLPARSKDRKQARNRPIYEAATDILLRDIDVVGMSGSSVDARFVRRYDRHTARIRDLSGLNRDAPNSPPHSVPLPIIRAHCCTHPSTLIRAMVDRPDPAVPSVLRSTAPCHRPFTPLLSYATSVSLNLIINSIQKLYEKSDLIHAKCCFRFQTTLLMSKPRLCHRTLCDWKMEHWNDLKSITSQI